MINAIFLENMEYISSSNHIICSANYLVFCCFFFNLVLALLQDWSLCWDHWEVVQMPHTNQALP